LDHYFIMTQHCSQYRVIYIFALVCYSGMKLCAQAYITFVHLYTVPFFWLWTTEVGGRVCWISLAGVRYGGCEAAQHLLLPHLVFQPIWGGAILAFINSSVKFLTTKSLKSQLHLPPLENNRIQLLSSVRSRRWKNNFMVHLKLHQLIQKLLAI